MRIKNAGANFESVKAARWPEQSIIEKICKTDKFCFEIKSKMMNEESERKNKAHIKKYNRNVHSNY